MAGVPQSFVDNGELGTGPHIVPKVQLPTKHMNNLRRDLGRQFRPFHGLRQGMVDGAGGNDRAALGFHVTHPGRDAEAERRTCQVSRGPRA